MAPALTWRFSPGCGGADGLRAPAELAGRLRLAAHLCAADSRRQDNQVPITSLPYRSLRVRDLQNPVGISSPPEERQAQDLRILTTPAPSTPSPRGQLSQ